MSSSMIRVSIVEDDQATREGFVKLFRHVPQLVCLGAYPSAEQAEEEIPKLLPDVVLMDINLPGRSGIECVRKLKLSHPTLQFVMLTTYEDSDSIFQSLQAGATGYLLKRSTEEEIFAAVEQVLHGGAPMSMQIARKVVAYFSADKSPTQEVEKLTPREKEILSLVAQGCFDKEVADKLGISNTTVRNALHTIYRKLQVQSRTEATLKFLKS